MSDLLQDGVGAAAARKERQLPINLFTRLTEHAIPQSTYLLPSSWRRFQLSELINKVLQNDAEHGKKPVPFEFVVEGEVLRGSLEGWVKRNRGGEGERTVNVEYRRSLMPPEEMGRVEVEDWVSGLSLARPGHILLSSYLSHLQILPMASSSSSAAQPITLPLPSLLGATSCAYVSTPSVTTNVRIAAGGVDRATHIFEVASLGPETTSGREIMTLHGHSAPVSTVIASPSGKEVISGSWDGQLNLYILPEEIPTEHQIPADPTSYLPGQKKRRKLNGDVKSHIEGLNDGDIGEGGWRRTPDVIMRGHKGRVGAAVWDKTSASNIWSAGWDGSVRGWDAETGAAAVVRQGPFDRSMLCIDQFAANGTLVTGSMDRNVCLWDTKDATSLIAMTIPMSSPAASIACHPTSSYTFAAATYAGTVQIWDIRSPKSALFSVSRTSVEGAQKREVTKNGKCLGERLLAVDWDGEVLVAGGEDGEVGIWRARGE